MWVLLTLCIDYLTIFMRIATWAGYPNSVTYWLLAPADARVGQKLRVYVFSAEIYYRLWIRQN